VARSRVGSIRLRSSYGRAHRCLPGTKALGSPSGADRVSGAAGWGPALPSLFRTASHLLWPRTHPGRQSHRLLRVLARHRAGQPGSLIETLTTNPVLSPSTSLSDEYFSASGATVLEARPRRGHSKGSGLGGEPSGCE
jgi:hypothetical protein